MQKCSNSGMSRPRRASSIRQSIIAAFQVMNFHSNSRQICTRGRECTPLDAVTMLALVPFQSCGHINVAMTSVIVPISHLGLSDVWPLIMLGKNRD